MSSKNHDIIENRIRGKNKEQSSKPDRIISYDSVSHCCVWQFLIMLGHYAETV
jgi:hypothetical protein